MFRLANDEHKALAAELARQLIDADFLSAPDVEAARKAAEAASKKALLARQKAEADPNDDEAQQAAEEADTEWRDAENDAELAEQELRPEDVLAQAPHPPEMVTFGGYLGGIVTHPGSGADWRLLYRDWRLWTWLLVETDGILFETQIHVEGEPFKRRDLIWVNADATVGRGSGPQSVESRFLTGDFTRAGDFDSSPAGGTYSGETGIFCESALCCHRNSP